MLTLKQLTQYYPDREQRSLKSVLVEYIQHEILDSLYKQPGSEQLSFMGGTAIRIVYGGNRFSEDLDFDNFGLSFRQFTALTTAVVKDMQVKGFTIEFRHVEAGAYHCYIKFPHLLHREKVAANATEKILVRIDTVKKEKNFTPDVYTMNRFDLFRQIVVNSIDVVLAQKMLAALERKRARGRDFYDISYLYGKTRPLQLYLERATGMTFEGFKKKLMERCSTLNFRDLAKDVEPFLIDPSQKVRVTDFRQFLTDQFERDT